MYDTLSAVLNVSLKYVYKPKISQIVKKSKCTYPTGSLKEAFCRVEGYCQSGVMASVQLILIHTIS